MDLRAVGFNLTLAPATSQALCDWGCTEDGERAKHVGDITWLNRLFPAVTNTEPPNIGGDYQE